MWSKNNDEKPEMSFYARQERVNKSMAEIKQTFDERATMTREDALQKKKIQEDMTKGLAENKRQMDVLSNKIKLLKEAQGSIKK